MVSKKYKVLIIKYLYHMILIKQINKKEKKLLNVELYLNFHCKYLLKIVISKFFKEKRI